MSDDRLTNPTGEAALLGAMLLDNKVIADWAGQLTVEDFSDPVHGRIFSALLRFAAKGLQASAVTMRPIFQNDQAAGYGEYLDELVDAPAASIGAKSFAEQIIDLSARRAVRESMHAGMEALATEFDRPVSEIAGGVASAVMVAESRGKVVPARTLGEMVGMSEEHDERINADPGTAGITNLLIPDMDKQYGALEGGTYFIQAGRPGMGKTVYGSSAALGWACNGFAGDFFGLEMKEEQFALRLTSDLSLAMGMGIEHKRLRSGGLNSEERMKLARVHERADLLPMRYHRFRRDTDIRTLHARAAQQKAMWEARGHKMRWLVIDYFGLIGASNRDGNWIENDFQRANTVSKGVDELSEDLDLVVLLLCQLKRDAEGRRPSMSDLRGSGDLEQDADIVGLLHREEVRLRATEPRKGDKLVGGKDAHEAWEVDFEIARGKVDMMVGKSRHQLGLTRTGNFHGPYYAIRSGDVHATDHDALLI